jgi:hypothetical protein
MCPVFVIDFFEKFLKKWQLNKAEKSFRKLNGSNASIVISENMLKFHNNDRRSYFNEAYYRKFGKAKISKEKDFLSIF